MRRRHFAQTVEQLLGVLVSLTLVYQCTPFANGPTARAFPQAIVTTMADTADIAPSSSSPYDPSETTGRGRAVPINPRPGGLRPLDQRGANPLQPNPLDQSAPNPLQLNPLQSGPSSPLPPVRLPVLGGSLPGPVLPGPLLLIGPGLMRSIEALEFATGLAQAAPPPNLQLGSDRSVQATQTLAFPISVSDPQGHRSTVGSRSATARPRRDLAHVPSPTPNAAAGVFTVGVTATTTDGRSANASTHVTAYNVATVTPHTTVALTPLSTTFNNPIGINYPTISS